MPIDQTAEVLLSLGEMSRAAPPIDGKRPHPSTLYRWTTRGVRGVRLEYVRIGHRIATSREALARFAQQLAAVDGRSSRDMPPVVHVSMRSVSTARQRRARDQAYQELEEEGIR